MTIGGPLEGRMGRVEEEAEAEDEEESWGEDRTVNWTAVLLTGMMPSSVPCIG